MWFFFCCFLFVRDKEKDDKKDNKKAKEKLDSNPYINPLIDPNDPFINRPNPLRGGIGGGVGIGGDFGNDINPLGGGMGGGGLMGPNHGRFRNMRPNNGDNGNGINANVPPNARFDPFGPGPLGRRGGPDPDHEPRPGRGPDWLGGGGGGFGGGGGGGFGGGII